MEERLVASLKAKPDMFKKLLETEDGELVKKFLDDDSMAKIYFLAGTKELTVMKEPPVNTKKKVFFFLRSEEALKPENMGTNVMCGDLSPQLLYNMWGVLGGVYLPLLSNPKNQHGLSEVNARELLESLHITVSKLYVGVGKCKGETMLPLPPENTLNPERGAPTRTRCTSSRPPSSHGRCRSRTRSRRTPRTSSPTAPTRGRWSGSSSGRSR